MVDNVSCDDVQVLADAADHVSEARRRARQVLGAEAHLGDVDDWRRSLGSARDALIVVWITWVGFHSVGHPPFTGAVLTAIAAAFALLLGMSTGRATHTQVQYYESELERERGEIRDHIEHERDEVRVLYAAKGFREPLLEQIVDTLCADDDRLLKVMMEEELGLSMHHIHHPLLVGLWNSSGAMLAGVALALPAIWLSPASAAVWMCVGGTALLAGVSLVAGRLTGRSVAEAFGSALVFAIVTGGVVRFLSQWLAGVALKN